MTTIAYRDRIMASDSCLTEGDEKENVRYIGEVDKLYRMPDGGILGLSGDAEASDVIAILARNEPCQRIVNRLAKVGCECEGLLVRPNGRMFWIATDNGDFAEFYEFRDRFAAVGSGKDWAYGAMEGHPDVSALQAVEAAARRHAFTRGPFFTMHLMDTPTRGTRK